MRKCYKCGFAGEDSFFKKNYGRKEGSYSNCCLVCLKAEYKKYRQEKKLEYNKKAKDRRHARKQRAVEYLGTVCNHCNQTYHHSAFDFHHLDSKQKEKDPGLMMSYSDEKLFEELDKCILLCANCHRIHHFMTGYD